MVILAGLIRRCLSILSHVCSTLQTTAAMADIVVCGGLGSLVRLLQCRSGEVQADATEVLKLLCRWDTHGQAMLLPLFCG